MPEELLPSPTPAPAPEPTPRQARTRLTCEFCDCVQAPDGSYLALSDKAKGFRDQNERIERFKEAVAELQRDVETLTRERDEARAAIAPKRKESVLW